MKENDLLYWVWFAEMLGSCSPKLLPLLRRFGSAEAVYRAREGNALLKDLSPKELARGRSFTLEDSVKRLEYCRERGIALIPYPDEGYPERLRESAVPPAMLFVTGNPKLLLKNATIAGIGSRNLSRYGCSAIEYFCAPLAAAGVVLVSGLALGADSEVHRTALQCGGETVAVLGCPIDTTSPASARALRREIEHSGGAVVSEYAPGAARHKGMYPERNRLIAALSRAVMIFEAAERSGTMITANWALESGRDVFAVPGSIFSANSAGTNRLIAQGAQPLLVPDQLYEYLGVSPKREVKGKLASRKAPEGDAGILLSAIGSDPVSLDELCAAGILPVGRLLGTLSSLEADGWIALQPGQKYIKIELPD